MTAGIRLCLLALALASPRVRAEPFYVIEQLVVGVNSAPGGLGDRIATIKSGDHVEMIERQNDETHVRLGNGTEGWVKTAYLSADLPLQRRLSDRTAEAEKLKRDVSRLESELATARLAASSNADPPPAQPGTPSQPAGTAVHDASFFMTPPDQPTRPMWQWVLGSSASALVGGFVLGWRMLDRRIRRKYGGLRIY
jgi:hypothetical protein